MVPRVLGLLAQKLRLQGEDVVQHPVDAAAFETMLGQDARTFEMTPKRRTQRPIDPALAPHLRLFEQLQAPVERVLSRPVRPDAHSVPSTSTRPAAVTRTLTVFSAGRLYAPAGRPSGVKATG